MKSGSHPAVEQFDNNGNKLEAFRYWVLPDKPMGKPTSNPNLQGSYQSWDPDATRTQTEQIRGYLGDACTGRWMETGNRFYFELEEDWEMFKTMCLLGWQ
jgi:hypothetical protein